MFPVEQCIGLTDHHYCGLVTKLSLISIKKVIVKKSLNNNEYPGLKFTIDQFATVNLSSGLYVISPITTKTIV